MNKTYFQILDTLAGLYIPDDLDLTSRVVARLNRRKTFTQTLRARPALAILLAILVLLLLTGIVYAIGNLSGYIPGIGIINQSAPIRVLAEPVTLTREGVTLEVKQAVLTADKTVIIFTLDGVQWDMLSHDENVPGCMATAKLRLPDGTPLEMIEGGGSAYESRFVFGPIPANINEATFVLPCILNTLPGKAPENWELPLQFVPAPPDMTVVPVIEIQPMPQPTTQNPTAEPSLVALTKVIQIGDRYIFVGSFNQLISPNGFFVLTDSKVTDANGKDVYSTRPMEQGLPPTFDWGFEINGQTTVFPITLNFSGLHIIYPDPKASAEFDFDAGSNPQPGQEWQINKDFEIGGHKFRLISINASDDGYGFCFTSDEAGLGVQVSIEGHAPNGGGGGGGPITNDWCVGHSYAEMPKGKLRVILSNLSAVDKSETWTIQWFPENPPANQSLYGISLKVDKYIPLEDGYYLIGHTDWTEPRIDEVSTDPAVQAFDANGNQVQIETGKWAVASTLLENPQGNQWVYHLHGTALNWPITLRVSNVAVEFSEPVRFDFDLRPYGFTFADEQIGTPWKTGLIPLEVPGLNVSFFRAAYLREGNKRGFEFAFNADPILQELSLYFEKGITGEQSPPDIENRRDPQNGLLLVTVVTDGQLSMPVGLEIRAASISGQWEGTWQP